MVNIMGPMRKQLVEVEKLTVLAEGSFENLLQRVSVAVAENNERWGGEASLFATHKDRVVLYVEDRGFFSCEYRFGESGVEFIGGLRKEDVPLVSEDALASHGIASFYGGGSVGSALRALVSSPVDQESTPEVAESRIGKLVEKSIWREYVIENGKDRVSEYASDKSLFDIDETVEWFTGDGSSVTLVSALAGMSRKLSEMNAMALEAVDKYHTATGGMRTPDEDEALSRFDSVVGDFLENIDAAIHILSEAIREARTGNEEYAVVVHDGVAEEFKNFHLGHRFVRKMASELASV